MLCVHSKYIPTDLHTTKSCIILAIQPVIYKLKQPVCICMSPRELSIYVNRYFRIIGLIIIQCKKICLLSELWTYTMWHFIPTHTLNFMLFSYVNGFDKEQRQAWMYTIHTTWPYTIIRFYIPFYRLNERKCCMVMLITIIWDVNVYK